jgi:hypothetical protein
MSSVLENFLLLFETNADKALAEIKGLFAITEVADVELNKAGDTGVLMGDKVALGAKHASFEIKELDKAVTYFSTHFIHQVVDMASGLLGFLAVEKLVDQAFQTSDMEDQLGLTAKALGVNVSELDAWDQAVKNSGGTAEGFQASLKSLNEKLVGLAIGGPRSKELERLFKAAGVNAKDAQGKIKSAIDILPELAKRFASLPTNQAQGLGMRLGLDQATILLLQSGQKNVDALVAKEKALGVVTQAQSEAADKFAAAQLDAQQTLRGLFITVDQYVIPILTDLLDAFSDVTSFLDDHANLVTGFFYGIATVAGGAAVYGVMRLVEAFRVLTATEILSIIFNPFAWLVIAAGLLVAAIALVYDDFEAFKNHQLSIIGLLVKKWPLLIPVFDKLKNFVVDCGKAIVTEFEDVVKIVEKIIGLVEDVGALPGKLLKKLGLGSETPEVQRGPVPDNIRSSVEAPLPVPNIGKRGGFYKWLGVPVPPPPPGLAAGQHALSAVAGVPALALSPSPGASGGPGAHGNMVTVNVTGDTTINTQSTDASAIAKVHGDLLTKQINQAMQHHADGVQS